MIKKLMTLSVCLLLVMTAGAQSKETRTYQLTPFNAIDAQYCYEIKVVKGNQCSLQIEADKEIMDQLIVDVSNNTLELSVRQAFWNTIKNSWDRYKVHAIVTMPDLVDVRLGSAARLLSEDAFSPKNLDIQLGGASRAQLTVMTHTVDIEVGGASRLEINGLSNRAQIEIGGASRVEFNQEVEEVEIEMGGASTLSMTGSATEAQAKVGGASQLQARDFKIEKMQLRCSGASRAVVTVTDKMGVDAAGASNITVLGSPSFTYTHIGGASKLSNN